MLTERFTVPLSAWTLVVVNSYIVKMQMYAAYATINLIYKHNSHFSLFISEVIRWAFVFFTLFPYVKWNEIILMERKVRFLSPEAFFHCLIHCGSFEDINIVYLHISDKKLNWQKEKRLSSKLGEISSLKWSLLMTWRNSGAIIIFKD